MSDVQFIPGLIAKPPHERAPEYVKAKLAIRRAELIDWLQNQPGEWINADVKASRNGKWYVSIDDWKPTRKEGPSSGNSMQDDEIPF